MMEGGQKRTFIVASGGYETLIRILDEHMRLVRNLQFPDMQVLHLAFSGRGAARLSDRLLLAAAGSPKIALYDISVDVVAEMPFFMYNMHDGAVTSVAFEPVSSEFLYSSSEDGTLQVWMPVGAAGNGMPAQDNHAAHHAMHGHPQTSNSTLRTFRNRGPANLVPINDVAYYAPQMLYFAIDSMGRLRIWDHNKIENGGLRSEFRPSGGGRHLQCIDMSWDHRTVVMSNLDGYVFIYRVAELLHGESPKPAVIRPSEHYVPRVRLSQSANLLVCSLSKGGIKIFRMLDIVSSEEQGDTPQDVAPVQQFEHRPGWVWDVSFVGASEELLVSCSSNTNMMLWKLRNMDKSSEFPPSRKGVICLAVKEIFYAEAEAEQLAAELDAAAVGQDLPPGTGDMGPGNIEHLGGHGYV